MSSPLTSASTAQPAPSEPAVAAHSRFAPIFGAERRLLPILGLVFLPWVVVVLFTAGVWAAVNTCLYAAVATVAGYAIIGFALPARARSQVFFLAPAAGVLAISAVTAFWLRLRLSVVWAPGLWIALAAAGAIYLWRDRGLWAKEKVAYGGALVVLSILICGIYFLPGARHDAVRQRDGSFNWIYVDTQYNEAIAANILSGQRPPYTPGTATLDLLYHFGPYAPAAAIARLGGVALGDAYARVTRGTSMWALLLSCFGVGTLLSLKANGAKLGGIMCVPGLFFYGSLLSLFTDDRNSSSGVGGAILFRLPRVDVLGEGGPFSHLILGHSVLHGLGAITVILGLCLASRNLELAPSWHELALAVLPPLTVAVHTVAALYCLGVVGILLLWGQLGQPRRWLPVPIMLGLFAAAWHLMGFSHSPDVATTTFNRSPGNFWWLIAVWLTIGLGFRIVGFLWASKFLHDPVAFLVFVSAVGLLAFNIMLEFPHGEQRYGIYFLQSLFSVFAFSRLRPGFWRSGERAKLMADWLRLTIKAVAILLGLVVVLRLVLHLVHSRLWVASARRDILPWVVVLLFLLVVSALTKRSEWFRAVGSGIVMAGLAIGFFAWITPWLNFGMGRMRMDVTLTPGEVQGLGQLAAIAPPGERFATNKHSVNSLNAMRERSYGYEALAQRPVLLEGYEYKGVSALPWFNDMLRDNDLLFTSADSEVVRKITAAWHVHWLVPRPGTDISLPRPLPPWLVEQQNCGSLKVYRVD